MASLLPQRLFVPGHARHPLRDRRRRDRRRHPRQEPPPRRHASARTCVSLDLVTADGAAAHASGRTPIPHLFWATVGGMGLTGVITCGDAAGAPGRVGVRARCDTERIAGPRRADARPCGDATTTTRYSVAWIDTLARGRSLGRSVLTRGDHATAAELTGAAARHPLARPAPAPARGPARAARRAGVAPGRARLQRAVVPQGAPRTGSASSQSIAVVLPPARRGRRAGTGSTARAGFVQYQFVVPDGAEDALPEALRAPRRRRARRRSSPC